MVLEMEMSKTYQYRKVMKPMLERKRRARINKCLDELKDIMVECLTQEGEHITRLEKADILELTVEHMKKLRAQKQLRLQNGIGAASGSEHKLTIAESFRAGYIHAANEVSKTLASVQGVSVELGTQLMSHLGHRLNYLQVVVPNITTLNFGNATAVTATTATATTCAIPSTTYAAVAAAAAPPPSSPLTPPTTTTTTATLQLSNEMGATAAAAAAAVAVASPLYNTPPPSECGSMMSSGSSSSGSCSPVPSESGTMWRPW